MQVSNISDRCYLGVYRTLECMVPLLQEPEANPHATLITLFMNVVDETMIEEDHIEQLMPDSETFGRLLAYLPLRAPPTDPFDTEVIKRSYARSSIANYEHILDR